SPMDAPRQTRRLARVVSFMLLAGITAAAAPGSPHELMPRDLGTLDGNASQAIALNDRGQIVGTSITGPNQVRPFLWESGRMSDLGGGNLVATDINDRGQIVLQQLRATPFDSNSCFLRDGDSTVELGQLGFAQCNASDLNNRGQVVGAVSNPPPGGGGI